MSLIKKQYLIAGMTYIITDTEDVHERLDNDADFAYNYISKHLELTEAEETRNNTKKTRSKHENSCRWSKEATLALIEQWQKHLKLFSNATIRNEEVWKKIATILEDAGFMGYTWKQAEDKWKNLRKAYMKVKDNEGDRSSGEPRLSCKFYDELDEILRATPSVNPRSTASSSSYEGLPIDSDHSEEAGSAKDKSKKKRKKTQAARDTLAWMSSLREDGQVKETARNQRHQEIITTLNRAISSYEVHMSKLIDKL